MAERNAPELVSDTSAITEWTRCPQCGAVAEIRQRNVLLSTDGPIEHVGIICVARHTFLLPAAMVDALPDESLPPLPGQAGDPRWQPLGATAALPPLDRRSTAAASADPGLDSSE